MCTNTQQYKTNKLAATYVTNARTNRPVRCLLYLKKRIVYQMTVV